MDDEPSEYIDFMVKYKDWIAIKRLGIRESTKPQEIVMHLANIRSSMDNRTYKILGINTDMLDEISAKVSMEKKSGYDSISSVFKELDSPETKNKIKEACPSETLFKVAQIYVLNKSMEEMKYNTSVKPELLAKLFPELKSSLPRGMGRKKKAKSSGMEK